ncbi:MAG TPA: lipid-binding SYLF domain-containing protein [Gemmatimonadaceae bacterium]|jgi:lipid-binding SYLF domain-containing protein|nr:lipid-binding SYLF domain-containing protein [Gemmatimonadaceae bacterium]
MFISRPGTNAGAAVRHIVPIALLFVVVVSSSLAAQDDKLADRATRAGEVLDELVAVPDSAPPNALLAQAVCVAVVPGVIQAGFGVGGRAGFGLVSCRTPTGWSMPSYVGLKGGSFGLQIGAQSADIVLIFVNRNAPRTIATNSLDLGVAASVAAGPVGRDVSASTDYKAQAEIYSYSKTKGLFAGVKITGTKWEIDYRANRKAFANAPEAEQGGTRTSVGHLLTTDGTAAPAIVRPFLESLAKHIGSGQSK